VVCHFHNYQLLQVVEVVAALEVWTILPHVLVVERLARKISRADMTVSMLRPTRTKRPGVGRSRAIGSQLNYMAPSITNRATVAGA